MAPKRAVTPSAIPGVPSSTPPPQSATKPAAPVGSSTWAPASKSTPSSKGSSVSKVSATGRQDWAQVLQNIVNYYQDTTPQRTKLLDVFMFFLVVVGGLQFAYCVVAGNYPFNAFLSGFSATVGQFVLAASLRIQTTEANKSEFPSVSPERAFADFIVCSMILHFFCVNFIN